MTKLARALLREVPLAHLEVYIQVLNSGILKDRSAKAADNGDWCGGGCDAKGGACGLWCAQAETYWGCFDIKGQSGLGREDLDAAIADPAKFRKDLGEELQRAVRGLADGRGPTLGPKVRPEIFIERG